MSYFFKIEFGVRQGLVLSLHLFSIYINDFVTVLISEFIYFSLRGRYTALRV